MKSARIMVVEDGGIVAKDLTLTLTQLGHSVVSVVASNEEALQAASTLPLDLVVVDVVLKRWLNDVQTAAQIQAEFELPVIFLTSAGDDDIWQRVEFDAPFDYLPKPFAERNLGISIEIVLHKHQTLQYYKKREAHFHNLIEDVKAHNQRLKQEVTEQAAALCEVEALYHLVSELISDFAYAFRVEANENTINEWSSRMIRLKDQGRAEAAQIQINNQLRAVAEIALRLNTILEPRGLMEEVVTSIQTLMNCYHVHIYLLSEADARLRIAYGFGEIGQALHQRNYSIEVNQPQSLVAQAARERRLIAAQDVTQEPTFLPNPLLPNTHSEIAVPLVVHQRVIGVLDIQDDKPHAFAPNDLDIINILANQIAIALENASLFHQQEQIRFELQRSKQFLQNIIDNSSALINVTDQEGRFLLINRRYATLANLEQTAVAGKTVFETLPHAVADKLYTNNRQVIEQGMHRQFEDTYGLHTYLSVQFPIRDAAGAIYAVGRISTDITQRKQMEDALARRTQEAEALAIENVQLYKAELQARHHAERLHRFAEIVNNSLDTQAIFMKLLTETVQMLAVDACSILLVDETTQTLVFRASTNSLHPQPPNAYIQLPLNQGIAGRTVRLKTPQIVERVADDPDYFAEIAETVQMPITSLLSMPMIYDDRVAGVIQVISTSHRQFTEKEVTLLDSIAQSALIALNNSQLYETVQQQARTLQQLYEVGQSLTRYLDLTEVMQTITWGALAMLNVSATFLFLKTSDHVNELTLMDAEPANGQNKFTVVNLADCSGIAWTFLHQKPFSAPDIGTHPHTVADRQSGYQSLLAVPLLQEAQAIGVLAVVQDDYQRHFSQYEVDLLQSLAYQAATILHNVRLHEAIVDSEAQYRTLFENATDFVWTTDLIGSLTNLNQAVERVLGLNKAALLGQSLLQFVVSDQKWGVIRAFRRMHKTGQPLLDYPVKIIVPEHGLRHLEVSASPLYLSGEIVGFQGNGRDMTQRLAMEQELIQAEKLAAIGRLAAGVAHEVNNPLAIISSTIQLLLYRWSEDNPDREALQHVEEEIRRISRIIKGLLDFARPTSIPAMPQDLNLIINTFLPLVEPSLLKSRIQINLQLMPNLPETTITIDEIKQVLLNLINNAADAMPDGGQLTITTRSDEQMIYLQIIDSGVGLATEAEKRLFDPFFTTKGVAGNGLGLSIVHGIITSYGGTIQAKNNQIGGCTVTIALPIAVNQDYSFAKPLRSHN